MKDLNSEIRVVTLFSSPTLDATDYSDYIDLASFPGWESIVFNVYQKMGTVGASNYITPTLLEASATPATNGSYSAVDSGDLIGSFSAALTTTAQDEQVGFARSDIDTRYLCVKLTETGTAIGNFVVTAILSFAREGVCSGESVTTGTVT